MNDEEYANMERMEAGHWYYAGKRDMVSRWLRRIGPLQPNQVLLDCGAGTGRFAKELETQCQVLVLDDHEEALRRLRAKFRAEQVLSLTAAGIPLPAASLDYITALDVLEHTPDDRAVVDGFSRLLKPGGWVLITVPASMALWSDWDEALHHFRRYSRPQLRALFSAPQWEVRHLNYTNVVVYPVVWLLRKWRRWFPARVGGPRAEDRQPSPLVNGMLRWLFVTLAFWRVPFPFGVSLLLVAQKRR